MRKLLITVAAILLGLSLNAQELVRQSHPRLLMDSKDFKQYRSQVRRGDNGPLVRIHDICMDRADDLLDAKPLEYVKDASNKRILHVSRAALERIFIESYAYRCTKDKKYLNRAEADILAVCSFPNWNPTHYLDVGEMAAAVAIGYDWLYSDLKKTTRAAALDALRKFAFETRLDDRLAWFYGSTINWNQVCNCGLVCAALATYESNPEISRSIIADAVRTVEPAMRASYSPDGNYSEGPTYWAYGTEFQIFMLSLMEYCLGTDFGLCNIEGFEDTAVYEMFCVGTSGKFFNYFDNIARFESSPAMWYFAARKNDPSILLSDLDLLENGRFGPHRLMPMAALSASKIDFKRMTPPASKVYSGNGETPVVLVRTGWTGSPEDKSMGIKGGKARTSHAHMDAGSFVYDAYGIRWAMDLGQQDYAAAEKAFGEIGKDLWNMDQESWRWKLFRYNNKQHNTLTVNGKDHCVDGRAVLEEVYSEGDRLGGKIDLTPVFDGDLACAKRTAVIVSNDYLEITDELTAPEGSFADIRWSMLTDADVTVSSSCIDLTRNGITMRLQAAVSGSCDPEPLYCTWPSNAETYHSEVSDFDNFGIGTNICGYTIHIPADQSVKLVTTLKRQ